MKTFKNTAQVLLAAIASVAFAGACNKDPGERRVDEVKAEAKDLKDRAEKQTERAKEDLDRHLDATKAAADRRVEEVKEGATAARDDIRKDVRGNDDLSPDAVRWRNHWDRFTATPDGRWTDDDWSVERGKDGELRAHRKNDDRVVGAKMSDGDVTAAVKGRFATADEIRPSKIDVDTDDGIVTLKGSVPNRAVAGEAVRLALGTKGVRTVVDRLSLN